MMHLNSLCWNTVTSTTGFFPLSIGNDTWKHMYTYHINGKWLWEWQCFVNSTIKNRTVTTQLVPIIQVLTVLIPGIVTGEPRQGGHHGGEEIMEGPGIDHVVVDPHQSGSKHHGYTNT